MRSAELCDIIPSFAASEPRLHGGQGDMLNIWPHYREAAVLKRYHIFFARIIFMLGGGDLDLCILSLL